MKASKIQRNMALDIIGINGIGQPSAPAKKKSALEFITDDLGADLWAGQEQIINAVEKYDRVAVSTSHATGKSFVAARLAVEWAETKGVCITTAPTLRQVQNVLWREIASTYQKNRANLKGSLTQQLKYYVDPDHYALGFTTSVHTDDRFQGFHAENLLIIVDEASGIDDATFAAIKGCLSTSGGKLLLISNPLNPLGYFKQAFDSPLFHKIQIGSFDTPNFKGLTPEDLLDEDKINNLPLKNKYLATPKWARDLLIMDCSGDFDHPIFKSRIDGQFPEDSDFSLFPRQKIKDAQGRNVEASSPVILGVDVARTGKDDTVAVMREGNTARIVLKKRITDLVKSAEKIETLIEKYNIEEVRIDDAGVGGGLTDILSNSSTKANITPVVGAQRAQNPDRYVNARAEMYHALSKRVDEIQLPFDFDLGTQLNATSYILKNDKIQIISKDEIKKIIKKSPDAADALALAFYDDADEVSYQGVAILNVTGTNYWDL